MVHGVAGAVYKSFATRQEAEQYLSGAAQTSQAQADTAAEKCLQAYVDGSFDKKIKRYSFGCVLLLPDGEVVRESGSGNDPKSLELRNVTGEMLGAMFAVKWAMKHGYEAIEICYDYAGIEQWATHGIQAIRTTKRLTSLRRRR